MFDRAENWKDALKYEVTFRNQTLEEAIIWIEEFIYVARSESFHPAVWREHLWSRVILDQLIIYANKQNNNKNSQITSTYFRI